MITSLRLVNFKNFADETLRLGPFTVIVGANASGKSNIRDAFRFLHGIGRGYTLAEIMGGKYGVGGQREWAGIRGAMNEILRLTPRVGPGRRNFTVQVKLDEDKAIYSICVRFRPRNPEGFRIDEEELKTDSARVYTARKSTGDYLSVSFKEDERQSGYSRSQPVLTQLLRRPNRSSRYPEDSELIVHPVLERMRFLELSPERMREPSLPGQNVLGDGGENLATVLEEICTDADRKEALISWLQELTPMDVKEFEFPRDPSGRVHLRIVERSGRRIFAYSASDGTLRFLGLLAVLLSPNPEGVYFFEEIDNGIHPSRLHLLIDLIEKSDQEQRHPGDNNHTFARDAQSHQRQYLRKYFRRLPRRGVLGRSYSPSGGPAQRQTASEVQGVGAASLHRVDGRYARIRGSGQRGRRVKVLIIPEDFRNDQYILKPLFTRLFRSLGKGPVRVRVCQELLGGVGEALKADRLAEIVQDYEGTADVFILCVDRDGELGRRQRLDQLKSQFGNGVQFLAENAWEEIETWVLAGLNLPNDWLWEDVRSEVHVKETYFDPLVAERGLSASPGRGREKLGEEASRHINAIRQKCPDDFDALARRLQAIP